jgi:hypothetical protein
LLMLALANGGDGGGGMSQCLTHAYQKLPGINSEQSATDLLNDLARYDAPMDARMAAVPMALGHSQLLAAAPLAGPPGTPNRSAAAPPALGSTMGSVSSSTPLR